MRFSSTRGGENHVHSSSAIVSSIACDGGLFVPDDIPFILDPSSNQQTSSINESDISGDGGDVIVPELKDVPISMSFEEYEETVISSSIHFDSFMELKVKNMRTFSGDVYRLKVQGSGNRFIDLGR